MRNDILYSVTGSIGFVAIVDTDAKFVFQRHIALIRPDLTKVRPRFLQYMISAPQILSQAQSKSTGIAQKTLSLSALRQFEVPIFSLAEQDEIIVQLERGFAWLETTVSEAARVSTLVSHLERSLLVKGLSGQLVSQHADDEPAVDALVRFRAEGHLSRQQQKGRPKMVVRPAHERSGKSGGLIMAKTRSDVKKDYLKALLLNMGGAGGPKELLQRSEMDVDEFYKQLRDEVKAGRIRESARKDKLVATNAT
jgi:hypothetical protein